MRPRGKLTVLLTALALFLGLAGCREKAPESAFDAKTYVEGRLAEAYLGETSQEYMDLVGYNEVQVESIYQNSLYLEAQVFSYLYGIEYPEDFYEEIQELYKSIYSHVEFLVVSTAREEDGSISVEVELQPIDLPQRVEREKGEALKSFFEKYPSGVQNTMNDEEYKAYDAEWARLIIDLYKELLPETGNLEPRRVTVKLTQNEAGYYTLSDEEFRKLDAGVIDYSRSGTQTAPESTQSPGAEESLDPEAPAPPTTASPVPQPEESEASGESQSPAPEASGTEPE